MHILLDQKLHLRSEALLGRAVFSLTAVVFPMCALDVDCGVSEVALHEREKSAITLIALASEWHFSREASESFNSKSRTRMASDLRPDTMAL